MRLPLLPPSNLGAEQRHLYDDMRNGIEANFKGFTVIDDCGRLIGPWNPWMHFPKFGGPVWELVKSLSTAPKLPRPVREIAILVTGHTFIPLMRSTLMCWLPNCAELATTRSRPSSPVSVRAISRANKPSLTTWRQLLFQVEFFRS